MAVKITVYGTAEMSQIAKARDELNQLELKAKASQPGFSGAMARMALSTDGTHDSMFKLAAVGGAVAGVVSTATTAMAGSISDLAGQAVAASDSTDKFKATLNFAGIDNGTINTLTQQTRAYADQTVYDLSTIQNTTAQLAANGVPNYEKLTEAAGNLNAVAGGNADTFGSVAMVLTQTAGAGKLTNENWNQLANAIPGASGKIQEALLKNGAYTGNFRDAMEQGQISSEEFNNALMELGTQPVAVEAAKSTSTFEGAIGNLQATITGSLADALNGVKPQLTGFITGLAGFIGDSVSNVKAFVGYVQDNMNWVGPLALGLGLIAAGVTGVGIAMQITAAGGLAAYLTAMFPTIAATWSFTTALLANPITWIVVGIAALIAALVLLVANWDTVTKWIGQVWSGFMTWLNESFAALGKWWGDLWNGIGKAVNDIWTGISNWFKEAVGNVVNFVKDHWGLLLSFITGPIGLAIQWVVENWGGIMSWFRDVLNGFVGFWSDTWSNISNFFGSMWDKISGALTGAGQWLYDTGKNIIMGLWNGIKDTWGNVMNWIGGLFNGFISKVKDLLGIHSPSTVFAAIGGHITDGLANGIVAGAPAVQSALNGLTAMSTAALAGAALTAGLSVSGDFGTAASSAPSSSQVVVAEGAVQVVFNGAVDTADAQAVVDQALAKLVRELRS